MSTVVSLMPGVCQLSAVARHAAIVPTALVVEGRFFIACVSFCLGLGWSFLIFSDLSIEESRFSELFQEDMFSLGVAGMSVGIGAPTQMFFDPRRLHGFLPVWGANPKPG